MIIDLQNINYYYLTIPENIDRQLNNNIKIILLNI